MFVAFVIHDSVSQINIRDLFLLEFMSHVNADLISALVENRRLIK